MNNDNKSLINSIDLILPPTRSMNVNVLVIDDLLPNLGSFKGTFRRAANIFTATSKLDALNIVKNNNIDIVFCDYIMPEFNGADVLKAIVDLYPSIKRNIVTAYTDINIRKDISDKVIVDSVIYKPYDNNLILDKIKFIEKQYICSK